MRSWSKRQRSAVAWSTIAMTAGALAGAAQGGSAGTLTLRAEVPVRYPPADCPVGSPRSFECFARSGNTVVPGLGPVEESYAYVLENAPAGCSAQPGAESVRLPATTVRLRVAGKGEIQLSTSGTGCLARVGTLRSSELFTITGGSGVYAGASGSGTLASVSFGPPGFSGVDTWTGTLTVPGFEFDLTPPSIQRAADKTVRVARRTKRVRVTYTLTAQDDVDGVVPTSCFPRSGSPFGIGRTRVTCSASDASGNTSTATFTVTVKRRR